MINYSVAAPQGAATSLTTARETGLLFLETTLNSTDGVWPGEKMKGLR